MFSTNFYKFLPIFILFLPMFVFIAHLFSTFRYLLSCYHFYNYFNIFFVSTVLLSQYSGIEMVFFTDGQ